MGRTSARILSALRATPPEQNGCHSKVVANSRPGSSGMPDHTARLPEDTPMTETRTLSTATLGRYLVEPASQVSGGDAPLLVGFHGYAQNAEHLLEELRRIPGAAGWTLVAVQAL